MALTVGTGPLSEQPAGQFDVEPPVRPLLFWEPFAMRFRIVAKGETIVDSRKVIALHETGQMMRLCAPWPDIKRELLMPGSSQAEGRFGASRSWGLADEKGPATALAHSIDAPPAEAAQLKDHVFFNLDKVEAWYLEDDLGYAHPCDPYHRCDVHRSSRHVVISAGKTVVAETSSPSILFETSLAPRFYVPPDAVRSGLLVKSETVSQCPYKGDGQHWHVIADGLRIADAAWSLTTPIGDALMIPRWFSFYPDKLDIQIDGRQLK